jgi:hypothetical protein
MGKTATVAPVLPGQDPKSVAAMFSSRMDEYRASRTRAGITMERAYQMATPMGTFVIAYVEAEGDPNQAMMGIAGSDLAIDRDFVAALQRVHGIDFSQAPAGPPPEVVGDWSDPEVTQRKRGLAFCAPLIPGRTDAGREIAHKAFVTRLAEVTESRRALGQSREVVVVNTTPMGDICCVYLEGDDPVEGNRGFAASTRPYDVWFKEQLATIFPAEVDFSQPVPPVEEIWDWHRAAATV